MLALDDGRKSNYFLTTAWSKLPPHFIHQNLACPMSSLPGTALGSRRVVWALFLYAWRDGRVPPPLAWCREVGRLLEEKAISEAQVLCCAGL